jgi:PAS domain S-box-containing protein
MRSMKRDLDSTNPVSTAQSAAPRPVPRHRRDVAHRFEALVQVAPDATVVADGRGRIRLVNRQTEKLFGYTAEELLGQPVEMLVPERLRSVHQHHRARYASAPHIRHMGAHLPLSGRRRDGSEFPLEASLGPLDVGGESLVIVSIRDITERQRVLATAQSANKDLRALQAVTDTALSHLTLDHLLDELLARVVEVMDVDKAAIFLVEDTDEGQVLFLQAEHGRKTPTENVRIPIGQGFVGRIAAGRAPLAVDDLSTFPVFYPSFRQRLSSVVGVPLIVQDRLLGVVHAGSQLSHHFTEQDVHLLQQVADRIALAVDRAQLYESEQQARRDMEAALARARMSEARFHRLMDTGVVGIVVGDTTRVLEANDAYLRMVGYTRADLEAGKLTGAVLSLPQQRHLTRQMIQQALETGESVLHEKEYIRKDGSHVPVLVGIVLLERDPVRFVSIVLDLSERKELEQERKEAEAREWTASEVTRQMDEFFALATHDIRSPVTAVKGNVQLAQRQVDRLRQTLQARNSLESNSADAAVASLNTARTSVDRLVRMTRLLFDTTQIRSGKVELQFGPIDLAGVVREQVAAERVAAPSRTLHLDMPERPVPVLGDADRLSQVLSNYLANALKYSAADQPVTVKLEVVENQAVVRVADHGPGLSLKEQSRIWELFHRAPGIEVQSGSSEASGSLGLGLHICKQLVELHPGGSVGVESWVGKGSTFWFRLPAARTTLPE